MEKLEARRVLAASIGQSATWDLEHSPTSEATIVDYYYDDPCYINPQDCEDDGNPPDDDTQGDDDGPGDLPRPTIKIGDGSAIEGEGVKFLVTGKDIRGSVDVDLRATHVTTDAGDLGSVTPSTIRLTEEKPTMEVTVTTIDDGLPESDETFHLDGHSSAADVQGPGTGTIIDNDVAYKVSIRDDRSDEGDRGFPETDEDPELLRLEVIVTPAVRPGHLVRVHYKLREMTDAELRHASGDDQHFADYRATIDEDFRHATLAGDAATLIYQDADDPDDPNHFSGVITFQSGQSSRELLIPINGDVAYDNVVGNEEYLAAELFNPGISLLQPDVGSGTVGIHDGFAVGTIVDDEFTYEIDISDAGRVEGHHGYVSPHRMRFVIRSSQPVEAGTRIRVPYQVLPNEDVALDHRAQYNLDFRVEDGGPSGEVIIEAGQQEAHLWIEINGDSHLEKLESFRVQLGSPVVQAFQPDAIVRPAELRGDRRSGIGKIYDDDALIALSVSNAGSVEGMPMFFRVSLSRPAPVPLAVEYRTRDGEAIAGQDYVAAAGGLIFNAGQRSALVRVNTIDDEIYEGSENLFLDVWSTERRIENDGSLPLRDEDRVTGTGVIADNETFPWMSVDDAVAREGETLVFRGELDNAFDVPTAVGFDTRDGSATSLRDTPADDPDYVAGRLCFHFPAFVTTAYASVSTLDDRLVEPDEQMSIHPIEGAGGCSSSVRPVAADGATGTIVDNDYNVSLRAVGGIRDAEVIEGNDGYEDPNLLEFQVTASPNVRDGDEIHVSYQILQIDDVLGEELGIPENNRATWGDDFLPWDEEAESTTDRPGGVVIIEPETEWPRILVAANGDLLPEPTEKMAVRLLGATVQTSTQTSPSGSRSDPPSSGTAHLEDPLAIGTIRDDDHLNFDIVRKYDHVKPDAWLHRGESGGTTTHWNVAEGVLAVNIGGDPHGQFWIGEPHGDQQLSQWEIQLDPQNTIDPQAYEVVIKYDGVDQDQWYVRPETVSTDLAFAFGRGLKFDGGDGFYQAEVTVTALVPVSGSETPERFPIRRRFVFPVLDLTDSPGGPGWRPSGSTRLYPATNVNGVTAGSLADADGIGLFKADGSAWYFDRNGDDYQSPPGNFDRLRRTDAGYELSSPDGTTFIYDALGLLTRQLDRNGNAMNWTYTDGDGDGERDEVKTVTDVHGLTTTYAYASGKLQRVTDFSGRVWQYDVVDQQSVGITLPDPDGDGPLSASEWTFHDDDGNGYPDRLIDPLNEAFGLEYEPLTTLRVDPATDSVDRFTIHRVRDFTRPDDSRRTVEGIKWDAWIDHVTSAERPFDGVPPDTLVGEFAADQISTTFRADDFQQPVRVEATDGFFAMYRRDDNGLARGQTVSSPTGGTATYQFDYDDSGRMTETSHPDGTTETFVVHPDHGQIQEYTDRLSRKTFFERDDHGNVLTIRKTLATIAIDPQRNQTGSVSPLTSPVDRFDTNRDGVISVADARHVMDALSHRRMHGSDVSGNGIVSAMDSLLVINFLNRHQQSFVAGFTYTTGDDGPAGLLETETARNGLVTRYEYYSDASHAGLVRTVSVGDGLPVDGDSLGPRVTRFEYDDHRQGWKTFTPDGLVSTTNHDRIGRVVDQKTSTLDVNGQIDGTLIHSTWSYDALHSVTRQVDHHTSRTTDVLELDPMGRPKQVRLPMIGGQRSIVRHDYNDDGFLESTTDVLGRVTRYEYKHGRLDKLISPAAGTGIENEVSYQYFASGQLKSQTNVGDRGDGTTGTLASQSFHYDEDGRLRKETTERGNGLAPLVTNRNYDAIGRMTSLSDATGVATHFIHDDLDVMVAQYHQQTGASVDGWAPRQSMGHDGLGNPTVQVDAYGNATLLPRNLFGDLLGVITPDPDGDGPLVPLETKYEIDSIGRVTDVYGPPVAPPDASDSPDNDSASNRPHQSFRYDALGRVERTTITNPGHDQPITLTNKFDAIGRPLLSVSPEGVRTVYQYKPENAGVNGPSIVSVHDGTADDDMGDDTGVSFVTTMRYDGAGRHYETVHPTGSTSSVEFDDRDRPRTVTHAPATGDPNLDGDPQAAPIVEQFRYDDVGRLVRHTDRSGRTQTNRYNLDGSLHQNRIGQSVTKYDYDAGGRLASLTDPIGNVTRYGYDTSGRLHTETNSLGKIHKTWYDANGNRRKILDRDGNVLTWTVDTLDRTTAELWADDLESNDPVHQIDYHYNHAGQLAGIHDADSSIDLDYDVLGRLVVEDTAMSDGSRSASVGRVHDAVGRLQSLTGTFAADSSANFADTFTHDTLGRVDQVTRRTTGSADASLRSRFDYDDGGRLERVRVGGVGSGDTLVESVLDSRWSFDSLGRLDRIDHGLVGLPGASMAASYLTYDLDYVPGTVVPESLSSTIDGTQRYDYDDRLQLTDVTASLLGEEVTYVYDGNGNRTSVVTNGEASTYGLSGNNQLDHGGNLAYQYDDRGNRIVRRTRSSGLGDGGTSGNDFGGLEDSPAEQDEYKWDHRGRLVEIRQHSGGILTQRIVYTYDGLNRRLSKQVIPEAFYGDPAAARFERYVYDGSHIVAILDRDGQVTKRFLHGPSVDQVLAEETFQAGGDRLAVDYLAADHLGSIRHVLRYDDQAGEVVARNHLHYNAFGRERSLPPSQTQTASDEVPYDSDIQPHFGYTGRDRDPESGLNHYRARYYDADTGQFISQDPIGFAAGDANLYRYVGNGPTNATDPSGLVEHGSIEQIQKEGLKNGSLQVVTGTSGIKYVVGNDVANSSISWIASRTVWPLLGTGPRLAPRVQQTLRNESLVRQKHLHETVANGGDFGGRIVPSQPIPPAQQQLIRWAAEGYIELLSSGVGATSGARVAKQIENRLNTLAEQADLGARVGKTAPKGGLKTWNEFQTATKGQFASRAEASTAWKVYQESRDANRTLAIGRLVDTEAAELAGFQRLNTAGWTPAVNDAWVQGAIDAGQKIKLVSPITRSTLTNPPGSRFPDTIFRRELHQLKAAGYKIKDGWAYPPGF